MSCSAEDKFNIKHILLIMACVFVSMLFCTAYTSPIYPNYNNGDSSIFMLIGKGIAEGKLCYAELFDHKGPILFFIEALGWSVAGRTGIWLAEFAALLISAFAIDGICRRLKSNSLLPLIATAMVFFYTFCHGNLSEDYSLPFIYISIYLAVKHFTSGNDTHPAKYAFIYGVCFGVLAFIRINNALIICAVVLWLIIELIKKKQIKNLLLNLLAGIAGIAIVALPICIYFRSVGALDAMINCTFLYNLLYAEGSTHAMIFSAEFPKYAVYYAPCVFAVCVFAAELKKHHRSMDAAMLVASALTLIMLVYSNVYVHYFTLAIPVFTVAVAERFPELKIKGIFKSSEGSKLPLYAMLTILAVYTALSAYSAAIPFYKCCMTDICDDRHNTAVESASVIPEAERTSVIGFEISTTWYVDTGITPCYKYYSMQHWWTNSKTDVYGEFISYLEEEHPLWLITDIDMEDKGVQEIIDNCYEKVSEGDYAYYRYCGGKI